MTKWIFTTPTVDEGPFAWNFMLERYRISRGITIKQTAPGPNYVQVRYEAYTDENGSLNLPANEPGTPLTGLNTFRGGYEHIVDDQTRSDMITSGVVSALNFSPVTTVWLGQQMTTQFLQSNLYNNTVAQDVTVDTVNQVIYTSQLMQGGIQLPDEGAPVSGSTRSANGDIAITQLSMDGHVLGGMYVRGAGHGIGLAMEYTNGQTHLWFGGSSSGGFSTAVCRFQFQNGTFWNSSALPLLQPFSAPNNTGVSMAIDSQNRRIAVRRTFPAGDPNGRQLNLYDLDAAITNTWTPLFTFNQDTFPVPGPGQVGTFQGMATYGGYCYTVDGTSGSNNTYITQVDWATGITTQRTLITALDQLTFREPEGCDVWLPDPENPLKFHVGFLFSDGVTGARNSSLVFAESRP